MTDLGWENRLNGVSLTVGKGEIVGLGGLDGQGQKELLLALFGVLRGVEGEVRVDGKAARCSSPAAAKSARNRMALVPEDRKTEGLMLPMSIADNLAVASLANLRTGPVRRPRQGAQGRRAMPSTGCTSRSALPPIRSPRCPAATSRRSSSPSG